MPFPRYLKNKLLRSLLASPVVLLTGGRQTGKTTLMKEIASEQTIEFITMDNLRLLNSARQDPVGLLEQYKSPLIIDEVQRAPELALPIKLKVDENRQPGMYALTGSSNPLVAPLLSDSLAGRMFILHLWPLSQAEIRNTQPSFLDFLFAEDWAPGKYERWDRTEMIHAMMKGGYPPVQHLLPDMRDEWFNSHLRTLLERDIQDLAQIRKLEELPNLLQVLANRSSALMNVSELSRTLRIPNSTLSFYLTLLEALFLIVRQPAWHKSATKKITKTPKVYIVDPGMMAFLIGADERRLLSQPNILGMLLETFVVMEVEKLMSWSSMRLQSYHYRTSTGAEVDLVLENRAGEMVGIEIKSSETVRADDFKGLSQFKEELGEKFIRGVVLYPGSDVVPFGNRLFALPMSSLFQNPA